MREQERSPEREEHKTLNTVEAKKLVLATAISAQQICQWEQYSKQVADHSARRLRCGANWFRILVVHRVLRILVSLDEQQFSAMRQVPRKSVFGNDAEEAARAEFVLPKKPHEHNAEPLTYLAIHSSTRRNSSFGCGKSGNSFGKPLWLEKLWVTRCQALKHKLEGINVRNGSV
jgi:hypothetical protein